MENKNLIWVILAIGAVIVIVILATKKKQYPYGTQQSGEQAKTPTPTASGASAPAKGSEIVKYFADEKVVNADIMALQQALNLSASGVNKYKLVALVADGKLGDKTATEIGKINATIGSAVKSSRLITKAQMRTIIDTLNA